MVSMATLMPLLVNAGLQVLHPTTNGFEYVCLGNGPSQGQNLALTCLCVPNSLDSGERWGARDRGLQTTVYVSGSDPDPVAAGPDPAVSASHTRGSHVCIYL